MTEKTPKYLVIPDDIKVLYIKRGRQMERERIIKLLPVIPARFDHNKTCFDCMENIKQAINGV